MEGFLLVFLSSLEQGGSIRNLVPLVSQCLATIIGSVEMYPGQQVSPTFAHSFAICPEAHRTVSPSHLMLVSDI